MPRSTKNSSDPILPQLNGGKRKEETTQLSERGHNSVSVDQQDVDLDSLSGECRALYLLLSRKLDAVMEEVRAKDVRLERCEEENKILKKKITDLESRFDDIENRNRSNNLILSGKALNSFSNENLSHSVIQFFHQKMKHVVSPESILSAYRLGTKSSAQSPDGRSLLVKLRDEDTKQSILSVCRSVKPADLYPNDDLTPLRAKLLYLLRRAKSRSNGKLVACGSSRGNVYAFIKPPNPTARNQKVYIKTMEKLNYLCSRELGIPLSELSEDIFTE